MRRAAYIQEVENPHIPYDQRITRLMHNKPISWVYSFTDSYLKNTSLHYLFLGGAQPPRVTIPEIGQFLLAFLPFFLLGLGISLHRWSRLDQWLLLWAIWAPVPASLTTAELPHTYRTLFLLVPIAGYIALGIQSSWNIVHAKIRAFRLQQAIAGLLIIIIAFNLWKFWFHYVFHQQLHQPWFRQYGYETLVNAFETRYSDAEHITMTNREGEPYIFFLFYRKILPSQFHAWPQKRLAHADIEAGVMEWQMFDLYTFSEEHCPIDESNTNSRHYYVTTPNCTVPGNFELMETIRFMDETPEFLIMRPAQK